MPVTSVSSEFACKVRWGIEISDGVSSFTACINGDDDEEEDTEIKFLECRPNFGGDWSVRSSEGILTEKMEAPLNDNTKRKTSEMKAKRDLFLFLVLLSSIEVCFMMCGLSNGDEEEESRRA